MNSTTVELDLKTKTIDIYGGDSPYTQADPYYIDFDRCREPDWISHLKEKPWMTGGALYLVGLFLDQVQRGVVK